jgi:hypothetical protein
LREYVVFGAHAIVSYKALLAGLRRQNCSQNPIVGQRSSTQAEAAQVESVGVSQCTRAIWSVAVIDTMVSSHKQSPQGA